MCLVDQPCYSCQAGKHADCDGWALSYPPGDCKGFPSHVPCSCAGASGRYQTYTVAAGLELPDHSKARIRL